MKKFNWKKIVVPIAMLIIGLLGGLLGAFILLTAAGVSFTNTTDTGVKTVKTVYTNITDTTKAVKKVQNAVVSVINYQEGSSSDSLNDLYGRIFGGGTVLILAKKIQKIQMVCRSLVKVLESSIKKMAKKPTS